MLWPCWRQACAGASTWRLRPMSPPSRCCETPFVTVITVLYRSLLIAGQRSFKRARKDTGPGKSSRVHDSSSAIGRVNTSRAYKDLTLVLSRSGTVGRRD